MELVSRSVDSAKFAAIDGFVMADLLREYGATNEDLEAFPKFWHQEMGDDPSYLFRKSTQTRWQFSKDFSSATRLDKAPFKLDYGNNAVLGDKVRQFAEGSEDFLKSSVHHAIVKIMGDLLYRTQGDAKMDELGFISGFHQFRVTVDVQPDETPEGTTPNCPTPEGVHQDGASLVMIMYINSENMAPRSGESRIYAKEQPGGVLDRVASREARASTRLVERNLVTPFETLVLDDREVKHDNKPMVAKDKTKKAFRDVMVFWTRPFNEADRSVLAEHPTPYNIKLPQGVAPDSTNLPEAPEGDEDGIQLDFNPLMTPNSTSVGYPTKQ
jgi:hypothetical protein